MRDVPILHRQTPRLARRANQFDFGRAVSLASRKAARRAVARKIDFRKDFQADWAVQSVLQKFFYFLFSEIVFTLVHSAPTRGAYASSRTWSGNAVDVMVPTDERHFLRTAKSCGPGAPMQAPSSRRCVSRIARVTVAKAGSPGRAPISRKPRAGKAGLIPPVPVVNAPFAQFFARGPRVHAVTRSSLRPLSFEEGEDGCKTRAKCVARM